MHARSLRGNREISSLTAGGGVRRRPASGRRGAEADDVRTGEVTLTGSTDEVGEQHGCTRGGVDGGKRWDREECGTATHGPDSAPVQLCPKRRPAYAGPFIAARRHLLVIRTVCGNSARTDLCGGCPVMGIPTAILGHNRSVGSAATIARKRTFRKGRRSGSRRVALSSCSRAVRQGLLAAGSPGQAPVISVGQMPRGVAPHARGRMPP